MNQDGTLNGPQNPAKRGSYISVYGTGFGLTAPQLREGQVVPLDPLPLMTESLKVRIGYTDCEAQYAGAAPGLIYGAIQVNVRVPEQAGRGAQRLWMNVGRYSGSLHYIQEGVVVYVE